MPIPKTIPVDKTTEKSYDFQSPTMQKVITSLAKQGLCNKEIASILGVRTATFNGKLKKFPKLAEQLIEGRSEATQTMVATLFETAVGGRSYNVTKTRMDGNGVIKSIEVTHNQAPPNPMLQIFWLTNEDPQNWRQYRDVIKMNKGMDDENDKLLESDKIAQLSRSVFKEDSKQPPRKHTVSTEVAHSASKGTVDAKDVQADVSGKATDSVQDNVLDVSAEAGTKHP